MFVNTRTASARRIVEPVERSTKRSSPTRDAVADETKQVERTPWRGIAAAAAVILGAYGLVALPALTPRGDLAAETLAVERLQTNAYLWQMLAHETERAVFEPAVDFHPTYRATPVTPGLPAS